ncbi:MAG: oligosaccharide flippase family protein [Porphyrobacter sp.]|nr:oligosaccharide flippase family protein [Porphyrobacter sp.]
MIAKNSLFSLLGTAIPSVVAIVTVPFYIEAIGYERYGALAIAWLLLGYFGQADLGLGRAVTQRLASQRGNEKSQPAQTIWSAAVVIVGFALIAGALTYFSGAYYFSTVFEADSGLRAEVTASLWLLALCVPIVAFNGVTGGSLIGHERFGTVAIGYSMGSSAGILLPVIAAHVIGPEMPVLLASALTGRMLGLVVLGSACWFTFLRGQPIRASRAEIGTLLGFGLWVFVTSLIGPLMVMADRLVIGALLGAAAVAVYTIPFDIAMRTQIVPAALGQALLPSLAANSEEQALARTEKFALLVALSFAPIITSVIVLAEILLSLWLGSSLDPRSVAVAAVVLYGVWFIAIANVPYSHLHARGNSRFTATVHLVELPVYILVAILLGVQFGLVGFAAAFALRCAVDCGVMMVRCGLHKRLPALAIWPSALIILLAVISTLALDNMIVRLVVGAGLSAASIVVAFVTLPQEQSARIRDISARLLRFQA